MVPNKKAWVLDKPKPFVKLSVLWVTAPINVLLLRALRLASSRTSSCFVLYPCFPHPVFVRYLALLHVYGFHFYGDLSVSLSLSF